MQVKERVRSRLRSWSARGLLAALLLPFISFGMVLAQPTAASADLWDDVKRGTLFAARGTVAGTATVIDTFVPDRFISAGRRNPFTSPAGAVSSAAALASAWTLKDGDVSKSVIQGVDLECLGPFPPDGGCTTPWNKPEGKALWKGAEARVDARYCYVTMHEPAFDSAFQVTYEVTMDQFASNSRTYKEGYCADMGYHGGVIKYFCQMTETVGGIEKGLISVKTRVAPRQGGVVASPCDMPNETEELLAVATDNQGANMIDGQINQGLWLNPHATGAGGGLMSQATVTNTIECQAADGTVSTHSKTSVQGSKNVEYAKCPAGTAKISSVLEANLSGLSALAIADAFMSPEVIDEFSECLGAASAGCSMGVTVDGSLCSHGTAGCADWTTLSQSAPDRVKCSWGPYTLPASDCRQLTYAYVNDRPVVADPARPANHPPVPTVIVSGNPDPVPWPPEVPLPSEPAPEVEPAGCPPSGSLIESGLQQVALNGLRCTIFEYPNLYPTSGVRPNADDYSDHRHGLAVDFGIPGWDTPAGNAEGWNVANWIVANADMQLVAYIIFDNQRWPAYDGSKQWVPYTHPSGESNPSYRHENHIHVSYGTSTGGQPGPGTQPGTPAIPETGSNPEGEGQDCLGAEWSWNPVSWVYAPIKCAAVWAFQPSEGAFENKIEPVSAQFASTPVGGWIAAPGELIGELGTLQADGCQGPAVTIPLPGMLGGTNHTIHPLDACSQPMATIAQITRVLLTVALYIGALVGSLSLMGSAFGLNHQILSLQKQMGK